MGHLSIKGVYKTLLPRFILKTYSVYIDTFDEVPFDRVQLIHIFLIDCARIMTRAGSCFNQTIRTTQEFITELRSSEYEVGFLETQTRFISPPFARIEDDVRSPEPGETLVARLLALRRRARARRRRAVHVIVISPLVT